ncbi:MAG: hypothetical protein AABX73_00795, partial [Nanoarchaeota archaeon]
MLKKIKDLETSKEKTAKQISLAEKYKKEAINKVQKLAARYSIGEINYNDYSSEIRKSFGEKTPQQWSDYYDSYIASKKDILKKEQREITKEKIKKIGLIFILPALILIILSTAFYTSKSSITGLTVETIKETYEQEINLDFDSSSSYDWHPEHSGVLNSIKLSGEIEGSGAVKVYLDNLLVLDSSKLEKPNTPSITGNSIEEAEENSSPQSATEKKEEPQKTEESKENIEETAEEQIPQEEENNEGKGIQENQKNQTEKEEIENKETKESIIKFSGVCEETCNLESMNLTKSSYNLRIEVSNSKIKLTKIKYEILKEEVKEEKGEANLTSPPEEKTKEESKEIKEEKEEETNKADAEQKNETEKEEITSPPKLIENIPDIEIEKNKYLDIELTNYFSQAEQYYMQQVENISTSFSDSTIRIQPDKEFIGTETVKIIAENKFGSVESNLFNITISELVAAPILLKPIPETTIQKNSYVEIKLEEYFSNAEQFYLLQTPNISTTIYDHTIKLIPEKDFVGIKTAKIIGANQHGATESNYFNITIEEYLLETKQIRNASANISTLQYKSVINRPQKWLKIVEAENITDIEALTLELPKTSENISIKTGAEIQEALLELEEYESLIESADKEDLVSGVITGNVAYDINSSEGILTKLLRWFKGITITGNVIQESELKEEITETNESRIIDIGNIALRTQETKIALEYYTQGPASLEENIPRGKRIVVSSPDEENYTDILAFSEIPEIFKIGDENKIKIYWHEQAQFINFSSSDLDNNGKLDYVEWVVPHLSNQTFDVILITKAEHLDQNKEFLTDIYNEVKSLDNIWSETIPGEHYIRVTFEKNLTKNRDITLYPRVVNGNPKIEVYESNKTELIAEFVEINSNKYNTIFLDGSSGAGLQDSQDTFDLKIINGDIEINHIIDPVTLTIDGNTVLCGEVANYTDIYIMNGGNLTICSKNSTATFGWINITLGNNGNFTVAPGGYINGSEAGAIGGPGCSTSACKAAQGTDGPTRTAGSMSRNANLRGGGGGNKTATTASSGGGGGAFGGIGGTGGNSSTTGTNKGGVGGNASYGGGGNETLVVGSGGGGGAGDTARRGGAGAGGIKINAGSGIIDIKGKINVNGSDGVGGSGGDEGGSGGGSGGHIILKARYIDISNSVLNAVGGNGGSATGTSDQCGGGGGGGGRILIVNETGYNASMIANVEPGSAGASVCGTAPTGGSAGTVTFNSSHIFPEIAAPNVTIIFPLNKTYGNANIPLLFNVSLNEVAGTVLFSLSNG